MLSAWLLELKICKRELPIVCIYLLECTYEDSYLCLTWYFKHEDEIATCENKKHVSRYHAVCCLRLLF